VGKTALALKWLHDRCSGDQLHVDLTVREPAEVRLGRLLRVLRLPDVAPAERAAAFRSIVRKHKITLVLDNASSAEQVTPFLPESGTVLVTTRSRLDLDAAEVELEPLTDETGRLAPLLDLSYVELPERQARLYRLCAWHPGTHFDVPEAAAIAGESECDVEDALDDLVEKALLTEVGDDAFRFHDLVRAHARAKRHIS
jgi:alpha-ketoglutarate-dependent taurine dioxygenase